LRGELTTFFVQGEEEKKEEEEEEGRRRRAIVGSKLADVKSWKSPLHQQFSDPKKLPR